MFRGLDPRIILPVVVALYVLPALHPLLRPTLGPPSHLLWWVHVLPVAWISLAFGPSGAAVAITVSGLGVLAGELNFGAGYGIPADETTVVALTIAVVATDALVAGFALWIRATEERIRNRSHMYRQLFEDAPVPYFSVGVDGTVLRLNRRAQQLTGYEKDELVGRPVEDLYVEGGVGKAKAREIFERFRSGEDVQNEDIRMRRADGEPVWISLSIRAVRGPDGEIVESRSVAIDIEDRKAAEAQVERLAAFPRHNPNPVLEIDAHGRVSYANEACRRAVARLDATGPEDLLPDGLEEIVRECLATGIGRSELRVALEDRTLSWALHPVRASGVVHGYAFDVTTLDEQLRHLQKIEAVGRFSGGIAHDFNNILSVVLSNCALLREDLEEGSEALECLDDIEQSAGRGVALVDRLLAFGRRQRLELEVVDAVEQLEEIVPTLELLVPESVSIALRAGEEAPRIRADVGALEQMLMNLVSNAAEAMPDGGPVRIVVERRVGVSDGREGALVVIAVEDEGEGIPEEIRKNIFEPFFTSRPDGEGTGLGLSMVYGLMQQHGGDVHVESDVGRGTRVELHFPEAAEAETERDAPEPAAPMDAAEGSDLRTILLVEDEEGLRRSGRRVLERLGYRVLEAPDGVRAEKVLEEHADEVALVVTDIVMPNRGGHELMKRARERWPELRFLLTSGYSPEDWGDDVAPREDVPFLEKPWTLEELGEAVREALRSGG